MEEEPMGINLHFDDADWQRIERDYPAWWAHELDRPLILVMGQEIDPTVELPVLHEFVSNYPLEMPADEVIARITPHLETMRYYGDAYPRWWVNFGPGIMAGFLGAQVHSVEETVWFEPVERQPIADLHPILDPDNIWWRRVVDLTAAAARAWGDRVQVGHTDLGGNLDILASLRTTEGLLYDLYDAPDEVERLAGEITALWICYYDALYDVIAPVCRATTPWAPIWSPGKTYMLQCDFSYMISPAMFERFVMPDLVACCDHLDHAFYHLDGREADPSGYVALYRERLQGIQWCRAMRRRLDRGSICSSGSSTAANCVR